MANKREKKTAASIHRTVPITSTLTSVPNYPKKLTIYQLAASPFWWVRYYADSKIVRRSTKTDNKAEALKFAKGFYEELIIKRRQGLALSSKSSFEGCAQAFVTDLQSRVARGEVTATTASNAGYRLNKSVLPYFGLQDIAHIDYGMLQTYLQHLSKQKPPLSLSTIRSYVKLVRSVMQSAVRKKLITQIPEFPRISSDDNPRGYFTVSEYRKLWSRARAMRGQVIELRKVMNKAGTEATQYAQQGKLKVGRLIRRVHMTEDLYQLIVFMTNSFIRPTDIKHLQHKHVEIVHGENTYLRLRLPESKKHKDPIVTMEKAVDVYKRMLLQLEKTKKTIDPNAYVFMTEQTNRDNALKELQRQFDVLLHVLHLRRSATNEERSLYSLRHTCIMFRLMYGEGMDVITLSRNARTSPEMIDRFYASKLVGEQNVDMIQSRRRRKQRLIARKK